MEESILEKDKKYIWHPFTSLRPTMEVIPIVKGEGIYLIDDKGNKYIDAISSWWVTIHGHGNAYIAEKIYRQALELEQVIFAGFTHRPAVELAERLIPLLPGTFSKVFYSDNGSTATEVAIKIALQYWSNQGIKRNKILAFNHSYHGDTFGAMSISDRSIFTKAFEDKLFEVVFIDTPTEHNLAELEATINKHAPEIAGFIYEPLLQGSGGMRMYEAQWMNSLLSICKKQDIVCIADEVMTGFGRTGKLFAGEYMETKADIICLSKGLTGGTMALGVTACSQKITDAFDSEDRMKTLFHGHSFTANPLACTAALASLDLLLNPECLKALSFLTESHQAFIKTLNQHAVIKNARSLGTILAFEYDKGDNNYLNAIAPQVTKFMLAQGVYLRPLGNTIYLMTPYCISPEALQRLYDSILLMIDQI